MKPILRRWMLMLSLSLPAALACSSSDSQTPNGSDAAVDTDAGTLADTGTSASDAGGDSGGDASTACTTASNIGAVVSESAGAGAKPTPAGGTIADGTYVLTKHEVFPPSSPDANTRKRTFVFAGNTFQSLTDDTGKSSQHIAGTFTTSGVTLSFSATCPVTISATVPYTATSTTFVMFDSANPNDVFTFTKQ